MKTTILTVLTLLTVQMAYGFEIKIGTPKSSETKTVKESLADLKADLKVAPEKMIDESLAKELDGTSIQKMDQSYGQMLLRLKDKAERKAFTEAYANCKVALGIKASLEKKDKDAYILEALKGKDIAGVKALSEELKQVTIQTKVAPINIDFRRKK